MSEITTKFILPTLSEYHSAVAYMGSSYEFTTVPGKSDYDIQFFIKLPSTKQNREKVFGSVAEKCNDPAWRKVKGGPEEMLDAKGYLSTTKVGLNIKYYL